MADTELADMAEETDPTTTDLLYMTDTGGTIDRKLTLANLLEFIPDLGAIAALAEADVVPIIDDPGGTPLAAKITTLNLVKAAMGLTTTEEFEIREVLHEETLGASGRFDVSSIPADYTDLELTMMLRGDVVAAGDVANIYFNNDTTDANYHFQQHQVLNGATHAVAEGATPNLCDIPAASAPANSFGFIKSNIIQYANTSCLKVAMTEASLLRGAGNIQDHKQTTIWEDGGATAINQITIQPNGYAADEFITASYLRIVGIKTSS